MVTILAASSTFSCSPPPARHYNLCSRRAKPTGKTSVTSITYLWRLLTLIRIRSMYIIRPTTIGWTNIYRSFNESTKLGYRKKQIQNKFSDLKRAYFNWRDGFKQSGLGRDPETGEVAVDPVWYAARHGESSELAGEKYKHLPFYEQLFSLFGHTPRDRGELVSAGGHGTDQTSSGDSTQTPQDLSDELGRSRSVGQSSKRSSREHSICSPIKKKSSTTPSLDALDGILKDVNERKSRRMAEAEEMAQVNQILNEDGYSESDVFFAQALNLCTHRLHCRAFLDLKTKEGRYNYVKVSWDMMTLKSKGAGRYARLWNAGMIESQQKISGGVLVFSRQAFRGIPRVD
ncbi:hypothetical protein PVAP13_2NG257500 [Panicum virgatum]|uniref:Myb/SANT-like domain-containing protein n=1 Tax=Panicum virgatum TaxID=38727 RepID=A0A8T0VLD5_PANVG|nr:hypothetical protein PVAP13_2NG257500 [Panicum virgatum]